MVRVGISNNFQAQVLEGLKEGDNVITGDASAVAERSPAVAVTLRGV